MDKKDDMIQPVEKQDSIELSRGATGKHAFKVKRYIDLDKTKADEVIAELKAIENTLLETFPD